MAGKTLIAGSLILAVLIATGWWLYAEFVAPKAEQPTDPSFTARLDAYLQGGHRPELVSGARGSGPDRVETGSPARVETTGTAEVDHPQVEGLVVDETGKPVGGARVEVLWWPRRPGDDAKQIDVVVKANRQGAFRVAIPAGESRRIRVIEQDTRSADPMSASAPEILESGTDAVTLRVQRAPNLAGKYVDEAGKPLTYKRVLVFEGDYVRVTHVETNWEGRFEARVRPELDLVHVKAGKLESDERGYAPEGLGEIQYDVPVGTVDVVLTRREARWVTCMVKGTDGKALRDVTIWVKKIGERVGAYLRTGAPDKEAGTGSYVVGPLRPGEYSLFVDPRVSGYARSEEIRVRVPSPSFEVVCANTAGIRGHVRGKRVRHAIVYFDAGDHPLGRRAGRVGVRADGSFEIPAAPHVPHRLYVRGAWEGAASLEGVMPGDEGIELTLEPSFSIAGVVTAAEESGPGWVAASQGGIQLPVHWDKDGRFEIKGLTAGDWDVHLYRLGVPADQQPRGVRVAAGTEGVRIGD